MELITKNIYKLVRKEEKEYLDKDTGEMKVLRILYLTDQATEIQEQIIVNEELYKQAKEKELVKLQYEKNGKYTSLKGITATKL